MTRDDVVSEALMESADSRDFSDGSQLVQSGLELDDFALEASPFPIVGIGASAGGLESLEQVFRNMSSSTTSGLDFSAR